MSGHPCLTRQGRSNGGVALHAAHQNKGPPIRLLVTDVLMPLMSAKVMAESLKNPHSDIKTFFTSGCTDHAIAYHIVFETGVEFRSKSFTPAMLSHKVRERLDTPPTQTSHEQT